MGIKEYEEFHRRSSIVDEAFDEAESPPEWVESSEPSYILYTSGTTGTPKGVQRYTGARFTS